MDEAKRVLERLERIEALTAAGAEPRALLEEVRTLLHEGECWVRAEGTGTGRAARSLDQVAGALGRAGEVMPAERALL